MKRLKVDWASDCEILARREARSKSMNHDRSNCSLARVAGVEGNWQVSLFSKSRSAGKDRGQVDDAIQQLACTKGGGKSSLDTIYRQCVGVRMTAALDIAECV